MKIRTLDELTTKLADELAWRKKELSDLKFLIESGSTTSYKNTLCKSGIAYLYAHWEGFIKLTSIFFLEFIVAQRLKNSELQQNFLTLSLIGKTNFPYQTKNPSDINKATDFFLNEMDSRSSIKPTKSICTESNLSAKVLEEITWCLGIDFSSFETKEKFINERLLGRRNKIAHGQHIQVEIKEYEEMRKILIELMTNFKTQIENIASTKGYLSH